MARVSHFQRLGFPRYVFAECHIKDGRASTDKDIAEKIYVDVKSFVHRGAFLVVVCLNCLGMCSVLKVAHSM